jgi:L-methionine (R)-S-oxide reductase
MAEELIILKGEKREIYSGLLPQIKGLVSGEKSWVANLANVAAALKATFGFLWVGFYLTDSKDELVLGPFQGPVACTRIRKGKGVCGSSWAQEKTLIIPDVDAFPGHIACSSESKSEIVVPIFKNGKVVGIIDVDSDKLNDFDEIDQEFLEQIALCVTDFL